MSDVVKFALIFLGVPFLFLIFLSFVASYFVALRSPPSQRAAWTVGIPYILVTVILVGEHYKLGVGWAAPLGGLPAAVLVFFFWRSVFRRAWLDDPDGLPEGLTLEDDDWTIALAKLGAAFVIALAISAIRILI